MVPNDQISKIILPDGKEDGRYLKQNLEWPNLENRLGKPRITQHHYYQDVLSWIREKDNLDNFLFLDAGCGHGNDLRAIRHELNRKGKYLGINLSKSEIMHGLLHYQEEEYFDEAIKMFALGDLKNLGLLKVWDEIRRGFSKLRSIKDGEVDLIHMEAVLQASGYGHGTYEDKKKSAMRTLKELARVTKKGGKFMGRVTAFASYLSQAEGFEILKASNNWRFIPGTDEFSTMLRVAGFDNVQRIIRPHEEAETFSKKDIVKISFLAGKI